LDFHLLKLLRLRKLSLLVVLLGKQQGSFPSLSLQLQLAVKEEKQRLPLRLREALGDPVVFLLLSLMFPRLRRKD
jgi:hypothetical protein